MFHQASDTMHTRKGKELLKLYSLQQEKKSRSFINATLKQNAALGNAEVLYRFYSGWRA